MDILISHSYPVWKLYKLNRVRLWKKIIFTSDMFHRQTYQLHPWILSDTIQSNDNHHWPKRSPPSKSDISLWKEAINLCFCKGLHHSLYEIGPEMDPPLKTPTINSIPSLLITTWTEFQASLPIYIRNFTSITIHNIDNNSDLIKN